MKKPLFTIITSTFNTGSDIEIAISSVRDQNRDDVEYIIVDGASSDDTLHHVERNRDVVTHVVSEPDSGIYDALNKGVKLAQGKLIGIIGCDDSLIPGALSVLARQHALEPADIYAGQTLLTNAEGRGVLRDDEDYGVGALISGIPFGHNAMFATKDAYERVGLYDTSYRITADANWVHRAIRANLTCSRVNRVLVQFSSTGVSSNDGSRVLEESGRSIRENFPFLSQQQALDLLYAVRGWSGPQSMVDILADHMDPALHASVHAALRHRPDVLRMLDDTLEGWGVKNRESVKRRMLDIIPASQNPIISFIVPAYNVAGYIGRCIESLTVQQAVQDIEIVIVDDGSKDETSAIVQSYMARDQRIKLIQQENKGQGAARAEALKHATGRYIWCIDSDDRIQENVVERLINIHEVYDDVDVVVLNFAYEEEDGRLEYSALVPSWLGGKIVNPLVNEETFAALSSWNCPPWRYLIRRDFMEENNITFHGGFFYEDHPFAIDVMSAARKAYVDTSISYYYLRRAGSTVRSLDGRCFDFITIRRFVLDRLAQRGLLHRLPSMTSSYVMPIDFSRALVPAQMMSDFLDAVWKDTKPAEIDAVRRYGSRDEIALIDAGFRGEIGGANIPPMESAYSHVGRRLEISRTLMLSNLFGLGSVEGPYPEHGLHERFHWVSGRKLRVTMCTTGIVDPYLVLRLRNHHPDQVFLVEQNDKALEVFPCRSMGMDDHQDLQIKLIDEDMVSVIIEMAQSDMGLRDLSVILERVEVLGLEDLSQPDFDLMKWARPDQLVKGEGTRLEGINIDVRVDPQPRPYVRIGKESHIGGTFVFERGLGKITIGDRSSIGGGSLFICTQDAGIHIGSNVMLSWDVTVIDSNSHSLNHNIRSNDAFDWLAGVEVGRMGHFKDWSNVKSAPIHIKDGAWIGFGSTILKGVTIGEGAIVGSKSVVTKDVPDHAIVAGNPAKILGYTYGQKDSPPVDGTLPVPTMTSLEFQ